MKFGGDRFSKDKDLKRIDAKYWRDILLDPAKARYALINMSIEDDDGKLCKVTNVTLENGNTIPVSEITEEQAHEYMKKMAPSWAFTTMDDKKNEA